MKLYDFTQNDKTYQQIRNGRMIHTILLCVEGGK